MVGSRYVRPEPCWSPTPWRDALTLLRLGAFRGIVLVGMRRATSREWVAVLVSSVTFGAFHLPNLVLGQRLDATLIQVVVTAIIGVALYSLRRASGRLWPCIVLHAAYDWAIVQGAVV